MTGQVANRDKKLLVGLSASPLKTGTSCEYAAHFEDDGSFHIYEGGQHIGQFGNTFNMTSSRLVPTCMGWLITVWMTSFATPL